MEIKLTIELAPRTEGVLMVLAEAISNIVEKSHCVETPKVEDTKAETPKVEETKAEKPKVEQEEQKVTKAQAIEAFRAFGTEAGNREKAKQILTRIGLSKISALEDDQVEVLMKEIEVANA